MVSRKERLAMTEAKVTRMRYTQWVWLHKGKTKKALLKLAEKHLRQWKHNVARLRAEMR